MRRTPLASSLKLLLEMMLIIGATELIIMVWLDRLNLGSSPTFTALLDTFALCVIATPLVHWRVKRHLSRRQEHTDQAATGIPHARTQLVGALLIFGIGSALAFLLSRQLHQQQLARAEDRFSQQIVLLSRDITNRFSKAEGALKGLGALQRLEGDLDSRRFRDYWQARELMTDFPDVLGFGFISRVHRERLPAFLASAKRDLGPDFKIKTSGAAADLYVIRLIEPIESNGTALGLDIGSEPVRRAAAEDAIRNGEPTLSSVITLVQDHRRGPGFLMLMPLYRGGHPPDSPEERRAQFTGFAYSPIVAEEIFLPSVELTLGQSEFEIRALGSGGTDTLVFDSRRSLSNPENRELAGSGHVPLFSSGVTMSIGRREFRLQVHSTPVFEAGISELQSAVVEAAGVLLSALLALAFWLISHGRARAEARALELTSEVRNLALVAERTNNAVVIADSENRVSWVNAAYTRLSGLSLDAVRGQRLSLVSDSARELDAEHGIAEALGQGLGLNLQTSSTSTDGRTYRLDLDLQPLKTEEGRYMGYVAVGRDITEAHEAQERDRERANALADALREEQALMDTINAHAIVSETDPAGRITRVNDAFIRISGYSREELLGSTHRLINSGAQSRDFWTQMWKTVSSGKPWRGQICNRAKDGRLYWVDSIIAPFANAQGKIERYVSIRFDITEVKRAQEALAHEQTRLETILDGTNIGTWRVNIRTGENVIDRRWAGMLGYTLDELTPITLEKWASLVHPEDEKESRARLLDYVRGNSDVFETERRLRHKDGHWIWILSRATITSRSPDGQVEWLSGTHQDVTERHRLYDEIEQRSELVSAIMENMPDALAAFDSDLHLILKNQRFAKLLDFPDSLFEDAPVPYERLIRYEADRGEFGRGPVEAIVARALTNARRTSPYQFERTRPNGQILEVRGRPLADGGSVIMVTDITLRRRIEAEARRADEMLRQAINTLDEAFVIYDEQDRLLICNQRYRDTYPIAARVMTVGTTFEEIIRYGAERGEYANSADSVDEWVAERLRLHREANSDLIQELGNGRYLRIVERKTAEGYTVGFRIDITDLIRARMAAEDASKSKSQFLANMSHEIRTPMNAILGMLELLNHTELTVRQRDYAEKTESAARSLLGLLNDILDFSKVEAGKMTLESAPLRMDKLLQDLAVILAAAAGDKAVEVLFDIDPRLPPVLVGDSLRLKQVLINLGGNALKFTERGSVVIGISVLDRKTDRVSLEFSVSDTGIGIAPENLNRIFEGFSQAEASTTRRFGGTGLGLAISSRLVGLMKGRFDVRSELGAGSRFSFQISLPVVDETPMDAGVALAPSERDLSALVVMDNPVAQDIVGNILNSFGWQVDNARGAEAGLALVRSHLERGHPLPNLIFIDSQLSGVGGWALSQQMGQLRGLDKTALIIMTTARTRDALSRRPVAELSRVHGFLLKPAMPATVLAAVREARRSLLQGGPAVPAPAPGPKRRLDGMRVLVVEDNAINQQVARELLQREGALVTLADNGERGVQAIASAHPPWDIVLMDIQMPVMDGYTATRKVRTELGLATLPIIAMTANAMEADRHDALAAGMNDHVGKPFKLDELVAVMLRHSGRVAPATAGRPDLPAPVPPGESVPNTGELDLAQALERLDGDTELLIHVLQAIALELPQQAGELQSMLGDGLWDDARRLMHTLKSTAATAGASRLSRLAAQAEQGLRDPKSLSAEDVRALLDSMRAAIEAVEAELRLALQRLQARTTTSGSPCRAAEPAALKAQLRQLLDLLRNSDLAGLDAFARLEEAHAAHLPGELSGMKEALASLDFARALELGETMLSQLDP